MFLVFLHVTFLLKYILLIQIKKYNNEQYTDDTNKRNKPKS
jgi:hypothetical protein